MSNPSLTELEQVEEFFLSQLNGLTRYLLCSQMRVSGMME